MDASDPQKGKQAAKEGTGLTDGRTDGKNAHSTRCLSLSDMHGQIRRKIFITSNHPWILASEHECMPTNSCVHVRCTSTRQTLLACIISLFKIDRILGDATRRPYSLSHCCAQRSLISYSCSKTPFYQAEAKPRVHLIVEPHYICTLSMVYKKHLKFPHMLVSKFF